MKYKMKLLLRLICSIYCVQVTFVLNASEESKALRIYNWHINAKTKSDINRLIPGTFTKEERQKAKEYQSGLVLATFGGVLNELVLSPITCVLSPFIVRSQYKIKKLKQAKQIIEECYLSENTQKPHINNFLIKLKQKYNLIPAIEEMTQEQLIQILKFADQNYLLTPPIDQGLHRYASINLSHLNCLLSFEYKPLSFKKLLKKFPLIFERYELNLIRQRALQEPQLSSENENYNLKYLEKIDPQTAKEACSVCLDAFSPEDSSQVAELDCKHKFHAKCIIPWAQTKNSCPNCRQIFCPLNSILL